MELRHLRYFVGVAEDLNFTRAARRLRVAQPALSRQIRQLEEEIGVTLLERSQRGVRLTGAGQAFLAEARGLLAQSEQAVRVARKSGAAGRDQLNIGYVWGLFHSLAPAAIERFRRRLPHVAVNLFDLTATQQAEALLDARIDLGFIGFADEAEAAGLAKRKVGSCDFLAVLPEGHRASRGPRVNLVDLAPDLFCVISERNYPSAARFVMEACQRAGFRPKILQAAERGHTILSLVAGNCGVALLPEPLRALPHPGVRFRPLTLPVRGDLFVAWNSKAPGGLRTAFVNSLNRNGNEKSP